MSFSTKKIRTIILGTIIALWSVSVLSLGVTSGSKPECDPECPMELAGKSEIAYTELKQKVVIMTGIVGWLSQYYTGK